MTGRELSSAILDSYISQDIRITDADARRGLTGGEYSSEAVVTELSLDATLPASTWEPSRTWTGRSTSWRWR